MTQTQEEGRLMKKLYRLEISGWWPVTVEEEEIPTMGKPQVQALYEECEVNPYDFDGLTLRLVRARPADIAKYGDGEEEP
jgi:hypothetical protein